MCVCGGGWVDHINSHILVNGSQVGGMTLPFIICMLPLSSKYKFVIVYAERVFSPVFPVKLHANSQYFFNMFSGMLIFGQSVYHPFELYIAFSCFI